MDIQVQWFPGHMAKARRQVQENLKLVDVVIELLDARIPRSSRNPMIDVILGDKPRLVVLTKSDLADPKMTSGWIECFRARENKAVAFSATRGEGMDKVIRAVESLARSKMSSIALIGRKRRPARCMVVGIPNVGKSHFINSMVGKRAAKAENKPGVTRGPQWVRVREDINLLDMPGILWPKFEDPRVGFCLAATGAVKENVFNVEDVAQELVRWFLSNHRDSLFSRYGLSGEYQEPVCVLEDLGKKRGLMVSGGRVDLLKASVLLLKEFRDGLLGRFTLDIPGPLTV